MIGVMDFGKEENEPYFQLRRIGRPATISGVRDCMKLGPLVTKFGRHSRNDFYLNSQVLENFISRWHAEIHVITDGAVKKFMLADKSLNGTYVNNVRVKGHHILQEGDVVAFGHKNGKNVLPGQSAPQDPSEFFFVFEKVVPHDSDYQSESEEPGSPELPVVSATRQSAARPSTARPSAARPSANQEAARKTQAGESVLRDISNGGSAQETSSSEDDVISGAVAAASKFGDADSDEEFDTQPQSSSNHQAQQSSASLLSFLKPPTVNNDGKEGSHSHSKHSASVRSSSSSSSSSSSIEPTVSQVFRGPAGWTQSATKSKPTSTKTSSSTSKTSPARPKPTSPVRRAPSNTSARMSTGSGKKYKKMNTNSKSSTTVSSKTSKNQTQNSTSSSKMNNTSGKPKLNNVKAPAATKVKRKSQTSDDNKPKKRPRSAVKAESSSDEDDDGSYHYAGDPCDSPDCTYPKASKVFWVQCDDCDKWYHTVCVGCSIDEVEGDADFQCGCT